MIVSAKPLVFLLAGIGLDRSDEAAHAALTDCYGLGLATVRRDFTGEDFRPVTRGLDAKQGEPLSAALKPPPINFIESV
jgi:hypothetical protein